MDARFEKRKQFTIQTWSVFTFYLMSFTKNKKEQWWLQPHTRVGCVDWSLSSTGVWTVATSCVGLSKPAGTPSVFGCGGPELAGLCVCGTPADEVTTVGTMPWSSEFVSPAAWFTGWTAPAGGFVSTVGRYTILAAIWNRDERKDSVRGEGGGEGGGGV